MRFNMVDQIEMNNFPTFSTRIRFHEDIQYSILLYYFRKLGIKIYEPTD